MRTLMYNEFQQVGVNFDDEAKVSSYDEEMGTFRDFQEEAETIANHIGLKPEHTVIEMGTGTGNYAIEAAKLCKHVYAVDVSPSMLKRAKEKAAAKQITNISFIHAGFLSYDHSSYEPADAIVTDLALHHLPDFWKQIAILRMNAMLKIGGALYLADQMYSFPIQAHQEKLNEWIDLNWERSRNTQFKQDVEQCIVEEHATFEWVMDGMLERAGFSFYKVPSSEFFTIYVARKEKELM
ncbi:class I SAM-dependent methyltransferase [Paenibacillus sp. 1001270B_150601_E10]|uniref:class I SAM-dependent methyltransferase n=1 Tax=Paenibacillus sp. 1001270B_150601_E10 TaxID=2787079 RepID=UPI0018A08B6A|nr:class I SAM-dependent methyltransferase [Paenibacillus sp. 1001270B_150601_E10]